MRQRRSGTSEEPHGGRCSLARIHLLAVASLLTLGAIAPTPGAAQANPVLESFAYDTTQPLHLVLGDTTDIGGVRRIEISWTSPAGGRVPAWLWLPAGPGPHPAVILQHGMPGSRDSFNHLAREYARSGAVVLTPSASFARPEPRHRDAAFFTLPLYDARDGTEVAQTIVDLRRGVDVLRSRSDVDPGRIALIGASWGGWVGALMAGVEHRILAYGLLVAPTSLAVKVTGSPAFGRMTGWDALSPDDKDTWQRVMARLDGRPFVARATAPHLRFDIATRDHVVAPDDARALAHAAPAGTVIVEWALDHYLAPEVYRAQAEWLAPILGLTVTDFRGPDFRR